MLKKPGVEDVRPVVEVKVEGPLSYLDTVKKDVQLLKKLQRNRKMVMKLNVFHDTDIERALEIKNARPFVIMERVLNPCYYRETDGRLVIDVETNVEELSRLLGVNFEGMDLKGEFEKEYDLDKTYRQCVFQKAREFTEELTHGSVVLDILCFINIFVMFLRNMVTSGL